MSTDTAMLQTPAPHSVPSTPALIERLAAEFGAAWVNTGNCAHFLTLPGDSVLFIAGDPVRFPECLDVAVVLPELQRCVDQHFRIGVAEAASEEALANRFGALRRPALVFLRDGRFVTIVSGMLDWDDYLRAVNAALAMPATRVPGIGIPVVSAHASASGCH